jgi:hypothetical protein
MARVPLFDGRREPRRTIARSALVRSVRTTMIVVCEPAAHIRISWILNPCGLAADI